ncbi:acyltransferase [Mesorhizobium sp. M1D.F.Ca.ET.184.01.1.1]|nr:acyltransferase [Mesorhizobium sp. M1D.F.Ca.ET.231.01.1.1]TGP28536.1 acyltransferase [Mesorhizobium sp. M1D.F.Ca.ET.234.01.1.1]TGS42684.1 acyltransferase [Mesorhizobium sp. M1D.F.Ca.ET.184.01.1.1]TGS59733.1 acyltransferase [Mesorhizobium sp. M1D.F.Ca.ET.183.01.1.1]
MHPDHGRHLLGNPGNARGIFLRRAAHDNRPLPDRELPSLRRRFSNLEGAQGADPQDAWIAGVAPMAAVAFGRNNPWLDLVRSAAILLVMLRHGERALHLAAGDADLGALQTIFLNGWVGVDLFFVLSGYLIARHLLRAGVGSPDFRIGRYLAMRALRIVPAYFAVLALVVAGAFPLFGVAPERLALRVVYHLVFLQDYLPSDIDVVFWSLGVEEKFYLLAPLLIFLLLRCRAGWLQAVLLLLCFAFPVAFRTVTYLNLHETLDYLQFWPIFRSPFHMTLEGLVNGVGIALAQQRGLIVPSRRSGICLLGGGAVVFCVWFASGDFMSSIDFFDASLEPALIAVLAGVLVAGAVQLVGTPLPFTPFFHLLSRLSYSLYLVHYPLLPLVLALALPHGSVSFWAAYFFASAAAASVLHLAIEKPFLRWKDRLARKDGRMVQPGIAVA